MSDILLYVAPNGNDAWSGTLPEPNADGTDGPLATPAGAQSRVRTAGGAVRVLFRAGVYCLAETWTLTEADSGTAGAPVTYGAYPGEAPVISGGQPIGDWREGTVHGRPCWTAQVEPGWTFTQLFVNGERRSRPRLPKTGYYRFTGTPEGAWGGTWGKGPDAAYFAPGEIAEWANLADVELTAYQLWFEAHHHIRSVDVENNLVHFYAKSQGSLIDEKGLGARYCVENVFEALTDPGEWYLDRPTGTLYYLPLPGETFDNTVVIAPVLACLLRVEHAAHLVFENLEFRHAEWRLAIDDPGSVQAAFSVPGAVILQGAEDCVLYGCTVAQVSTYAIEVLKPSHDVRIIACELHDLGAGGVKIGHEGLRARLDGEVEEAIPASPRGMRVTVSDCRIHDGGLIHPSAIGVWIGNSGRNRVRHNAIFNFHYTGVSCGWTWGYAPTLTLDNRIEYNHIHHCGQGLLSDLGGIYMLGTQPGTVIRGNLIHDIAKYGYGGWGIYTDEGSSEMRIEGNIAYRTAEQGFFQHYGKDNLVRNNILADCDGLGRGREEPHRSFVIERNLILAREGHAVLGQWGNGHFTLNDNLYWPIDDVPLSFAGVQFADWQAWGQDIDSAIADPLLHDVASGTFTLRADSPALSRGFLPLHPLPAGPRFSGLRPARYAELPPEALPPARIVRTRLEVVDMPGDHPGTIKLIARNCGETPETGAIRLVAERGGVLHGDRRLAFALEPGEEAALLCALTTGPDAAEVMLAAYPETDAAVPTALYLSNLRDWTAVHLAGALAVSDVPAALAGAESRAVTSGPLRLAELRLGVAGADLALLARVADPCPAQDAAAPWAASCIELFAALPGSEAIGQVFLLPATPDAPAQAFHAADGPQPAPAIRLHTLPVDGGYLLAALIPLAMLALPSDSETFRLEAAVSIPRAGAVLRATLFGSTQAYATAEQYGTVVVR